MKWLLIFYKMNLIIHHLVIIPKKKKERKHFFLWWELLGFTLLTTSHTLYASAEHVIVLYIISPAPTPGNLQSDLFATGWFV